MNHSTSDNETNPEELMEFVLEDGTPIQISKSEYRTKVLPDMLKSNWDDPANLYSLIHQAIDDDLVDDILPALARLQEIDPIHDRAMQTKTNVMIQQKKYTEVKEITQAFIQDHPNNAVAYLNLARAESFMGNEDATFTAIKKVVELDANMANPLNWYLDLLYNKAGAQIEQEELQRIASLENNYYAKLKLGMRFLENDQHEEALLWFKQTIETESVDSNVLIEISANMGHGGFIKELKEWMAPIFDAKKHDTRVALNLLNCCVELNDSATGKNLLFNLKMAGYHPQFKDAIEEFTQKLT